MFNENFSLSFQQSPGPPQFVYWQRNDRMVNYDDNRRDISIETIPGPRTQSRLIIKEPQISDSGNFVLNKSIWDPLKFHFSLFFSTGNYTCRASNTEPASIYVYVSKGKWTTHWIELIPLLIAVSRHPLPPFKSNSLCLFLRECLPKNERKTWNCSMMKAPCLLLSTQSTQWITISNKRQHKQAQKWEFFGAETEKCFGTREKVSFSTCPPSLNSTRIGFFCFKQLIIFAFRLGTYKAFSRRRRKKGIKEINKMDCNVT